MPKWHRLTNRLASYDIELMRTKQSRKDIAVVVNVSPSTIARWLALLHFDKPKRLPRVLSIDEFRGNTEYGKFQCIMTAPTEKRIFDILPTYKDSDIYRYLKTFPNRHEVEYFVSDMKKEYISLAKHLFPNATIVIDRFHVVCYCTWAIENVRKRVQKKLLPEQRKYFKRSRKLLLAHMEKLKPEAKAAVERMLLFDRDLREAYLLKEAFYQFMASTSSAQAKQKLLEFRLHATVADIPEFSSCLSVLKN
ncbi:MAG: transposase [Clostridia bacterium]|nr:transposase [Clostridia bacterium]